MPCYTPDESRSDIEQRLMANLLLYLDNLYAVELSPEELKQIEVDAKGAYSSVNCDAYTKLLCEACHKMQEDGRDDRIIYDGKNPEARKLADWWDSHKEFDRKRLLKEGAKSKWDELKKEAISKLTEEERNILGL